MTCRAGHRVPPLETTLEPFSGYRVPRDMKSVFSKRFCNALGLLILAAVLSGCASIISSAATNLSANLSSAILNQDDPELVRAGAPSYLLLLDSFVEGSPDDPAILAAGAALYATYGAVFADDELRASRLTTRARRYAGTAMCETYEPACGWGEASYDEFVASLAGLRPRNAEYL